MTTMTQQLQKRLMAAAVELFEECRTSPPTVRVEMPSDPKFGDYSTNLAMQLAPIVKDGPMRIAEKLKATMGTMPGIATVDVVPPGFINFRVDAAWWPAQPTAILKAAKDFGAVNIGQGQRVIVEFVSANPTGPIHVGNGRAAFIGDTLANVMEQAGYKPFREFYVNNAGNQIDILADSVVRRAFQLQGVKVDYPDELYQGEYVKDIAKRLHLKQYKVRPPQELRERIKGRVVDLMVAELQRVMEKKAGVKYARWFRETELYEKQKVVKALDVLRKKGLLYEQDGATWFKTTQFGDDKDRVVVKSDKSYTYIVPDIALRWDRFAQRRFDREVILLGADHHSYVSRLKAASAAIGHPGKIEVILIQLVRLISHGQEVKMSKRAGTYVTLEELIDEVGLDVARFFFLMHAANTHMDFDLDLAKEKTDKNPVFYVQYAHARICSILKKAKAAPLGSQQPLADPSAVTLVKELLRLPELIEEVAVSYDVHKLPFYAMRLAETFHVFYSRVRVIDQGAVNPAALELVQATKLVLAKTLKLMGVTAPEKM
ncbi:MAG: arginine--tRNA ligase [Candidatus Kerfeldbacteria bacterium]|nr:arginine--tRNA ligase [Candidatus Kerfeldbacteria bacterium]